MNPHTRLCFAMHGAVAQLIERSFNGRGCRTFEAYQRHAHQVALRVVTRGYFFVSHSA